MKKGIIFLALVVMLFTCMAIPGYAINPSEQKTEPNVQFTFSPPFANSLAITFEDAVPSNYSPYAPGERLDAFLDGNGIPTSNSSYYQDTCLALIDSNQYNNGYYVLASNTITTGTTLNVYKSFTYQSGYGPSSSIPVKVVGYPANYYFSTAYGIIFHWYF